MRELLVSERIRSSFRLPVSERMIRKAISALTSNFLSNCSKKFFLTNTVLIRLSFLRLHLPRFGLLWIREHSDVRDH